MSQVESAERDEPGCMEWTWYQCDTKVPPGFVTSSLD